MTRGASTQMVDTDVLMTARLVWKRQDMESALIRMNVPRILMTASKAWFVRTWLEDMTVFVQLVSEQHKQCHLVKMLMNVDRFLVYVSIVVTTQWVDTTVSVLLDIDSPIMEEIVTILMNVLRVSNA
jgi:hypothetical protein